MAIERDVVLQWRANAALNLAGEVERVHALAEEQTDEAQTERREALAEAGHWASIYTALGEILDT